MYKRQGLHLLLRQFHLPSFPDSIGHKFALPVSLAVSSQRHRPTPETVFPPEASPVFAASTAPHFQCHSRNPENTVPVSYTHLKGIDDYTGTYTADYANFSGTEYLFGGTSIKREAGKELSIDCTLEITEGTAKVFWISGSDEAVTLIEATGTYSDIITLPDGGNYIGIECGNFTGNIELNIE